MIKQLMPQAIEWLALVGGFYMIFLGCILSTKNLQSAVIMRFLPIVSGLAVVLHILI